MTDTHSPAPEMPSVRLLPKANARAVRHGFPWVYANEMVLDRRTKKLAPGTLALLEDSARQPMGIVAVNPLSKIAARMIDQDVTAVIDQNWFEAHFARALVLQGSARTSGRRSHADGVWGLGGRYCRPFRRVEIRHSVRAFHGVTDRINQ